MLLRKNESSDKNYFVQYIGQLLERSDTQIDNEKFGRKIFFLQQSAQQKLYGNSAYKNRSDNNANDLRDFVI
jgi:hypothetical protein